MPSGTFASLRSGCCLLLALALPIMVSAQQPAATSAPLGTPPPRAFFPHPHFAFEFAVTLAPAVVLGQTAFGHRQYIPITGGRIAGPKLTGEVLPGGWDYQLELADGCTQLSADYFIRPNGGPVIHVLNGGIACPAGKPGTARNFFRPRFEAPKGAYEWLTRGTFVASLELDPSPTKGADGVSQPLKAIRLKIYQLE